MRRPGRGARDGFAILGALLLIASCGDNGSRAAGRFHPSRPGILTVTTAQVPAPGFWEGSAAAPTGGFEWGLAQAMAKRFGLAQVEAVVVPFEDLIAGNLGGADLALSQLTPSVERDKVLDFSEPYLPAKPAVLVRAGTRVDDMAAARDQRWSVRHRSTLEAFLSETVRPKKPVQSVDARQTSLDALTAGQVDAVLLDLPVAAAIASRSGGRLEVTGQFPSEDNLAVVLPDDSSNKEAVNSALRALASNGTLRELADRWLGVAVTGGAAEDVPLIQIPS